MPLTLTHFAGRPPTDFGPSGPACASQDGPKRLTDASGDARLRDQATRQIFSILVPPGAPMGSPQVMT